MLTRTPFWRGLVAAIAFTALATVAPSAALTIGAPETAAQTLDAALSERLAAVEQAIEAKRRKLGVPGVALVIVKDGKIILLKGFGQKDLTQALPVTAHTLFPIGSATKAFTAMAALISADEGRLSLDDLPRKHLPYFKLHDAEIDANIVLRDLLNHSSGLARADLSWLGTPLTREEAIRLMAQARPTSKLRQTFQYQNNMYSAAGEIIGRVNGSTWEQVVIDRLFRPLGMSSSVVSMAEMRRAADVSTGHSLTNGKAEAATLVDMDNMAAAGAIGSSARDMAQWLRLMLGGGELEGRRLVSKRAFQEMSKSHIAFGNGGYGLGWFIEARNGHKVLHHGGNVPGFESLVYLVPEKQLGFALLTNVSGSALPAAVIDAIWNNLTEQPSAAPAKTVPVVSSEEAQSEVGRYVTAGFAMELRHKDGKLYAAITGQPEYALIPLGGRRYQLGAPAPGGFYVTLRPKQGDAATTELFLEQPQGNLLLVKETAYTGAYRELIGSYEFQGQPVEIIGTGGKLGLLIPRQAMYTLVEQARDQFALVPLPDTFRMLVTRDAEGSVKGVLLQQPNGTFTLTRKIAAQPALPSAAEIMERSIAAHGLEAFVRKPRAIVVTAEAVLENQGIIAEIITRQHMAKLNTTTALFKAFGKPIGRISIRFDGKTSVTESSFGGTKSTEGDGEDFDHYALVNWKTVFKSVAVTGIATIENEEVYVITKVRQNDRPIVDYVSTKSFLPLKRETTTASGAVSTEYFGDYRAVEGVMIPMRSLTLDPVLGRILTSIKEVTFEDDIAPAKFERSQ
jgi:CubicO group peptidase (beta-lactamase class C family)